jgi:N-acyl-D-aspartate/D-glutamate deacylase
MADRDLLIRGGEVIDGTGAPALRADVRVRGGRIAEVAPGLAPDGERVIDAGGAVVTPGFIDTHAHTDPQVFWDPALDPDPLHGVTTMLVGNCSLSLYPASPETRGTISDLFSYIEDVPRHLFDDNVPWTWTDYAGYRDTVNATGTGINLAALVGHSPLRLAVMGDDAWTRAATADEISAMASLLDDAMQAGAWGLSTSLLDVDQHGRRAPRRATSSTGCSTSSRAPAAVSSSSSPACSATAQRSPSKTSPAAVERATSPSRGPASPTPTPIQATRSDGSTSRTRSAPRASASIRSCHRAPSTSGSTGTPR